MMPTLVPTRPASKRGEARFPGALLLLFPLLALGLGIAYLQGMRPTPGAYPDAPGGAVKGDVPTWVGQLELPGGGEVSVHLTRLHPDPHWQDFETQTLRQRFELPAGEPWQVQLSADEACPEALDLKGLHVQATDSQGLRALTQPGPGGDLRDPVQVLFGVPQVVHAGESVRFVLWGSAPLAGAKLLGGELELELHSEQRPHLGGSIMGRGPAQLALGPTGRSLFPDTPAAVASERLAWAREREEFELEILRLTGELENVMLDRVAREEEFIEFNQLISSIVPPQAPPELLAILGIEPPLAEVEPSADPEYLRLKARADMIFRELKALLVTERLDSLVLLEVGLPADGCVGPVVFRQLNARGRPVGTLCADRLRLEGSRFGRTLTLVLEDGYERRDGRRYPFAGTQEGEERGGERRIFLSNTDPTSWLVALPDLFGEVAPVAIDNDGRWHGFLVHRKLNDLLQTDTQLGYYRLSALGGVSDDQLRGVELEELDKAGRLVKRLVADRLTISLEPRGVLLLLEDGIQMQGAKKFAFLDGRYRLFLPGAKQADWIRAGLPGLVSSEDSELGT